MLCLYDHVSWCKHPLDIYDFEQAMHESDILGCSNEQLVDKLNQCPGWGDAAAADPLRPRRTEAEPAPDVRIAEHDQIARWFFHWPALMRLASAMMASSTSLGLIFLIMLT